MKQLSQILIESQNTRKQTTGKLFQITPTDEIESYCAMGALMCEAGLVKSTHDPIPSTAAVFQALGLESRIPELKNKIICPLTGEPKAGKACSPNCTQCNGVCGGPRTNVADMIIHLNDSHGQSFEQIGKWLESIGF